MGIERPDYYVRDIHTVDGKTAKIEVWDIFEAFGLSVPKSFAAKYILRAGNKDPNKEIEDLNKAIICLRREIKELTMKLRDEVQQEQAGMITAYVPRQGARHEDSNQR